MGQFRSFQHSRLETASKRFPDTPMGLDAPKVRDHGRTLRAVVSFQRAAGKCLHELGCHAQDKTAPVLGVIRRSRPSSVRHLPSPTCWKIDGIGIPGDAASALLTT